MSFKEFLIISLTRFHLPPKKQISLDWQNESDLSTHDVREIGPSSASIISVTVIFLDLFLRVYPP